MEGLPVCVRSQRGLKRVLLTIGGVRLIEVDLFCLTSGFEFGVVEVSPSPDAAVVQPLVCVHTSAVKLTFGGAATQTPVIKLPVPAAAQAAVVQLSLPRAAQAAVVEVPGAATAEAELVEVKVQEAALCARQRHKAALRVPSAQVVVVACRGVCVRGGAQERGVFGLRAS